MHRLTTKIMQRIWRLTRGLTLGAQGIVLDDQQRVLLVRHGYRPGWHFPGGGVEKGETTLQALTRELREEAGVELDDTPQLHGIFTNFKVFPGDHVTVYVVRQWHQSAIPKPNMEIREQKFVSYEELPTEIAVGARNRLAEVFDRTPLDTKWV